MSKNDLVGTAYVNGFHAGYAAAKGRRPILHTSSDTVVSVIQSAAEEMCDRYCKFPEQYDDEEALIKERCEFCPLTRLM